MMKLKRLYVGLAIALATSMAAQVVSAKDRYLVIYKSQQGFWAMNNFMSLEASAQSYGLQKSLKHVNGMILKTKNPHVIETLKNHPEVAVVEAETYHPLPEPVNGFKISRVSHDEEVVVASPQDAPAFTPGAATPWGILAVKAPEAWALADSGSKARVLVLDTGIDPQHQDLVGNFEKGQNFFESDMGPNPDDYIDHEGHGTHCAGTIAATYNAATGFTGVAPKAKILAGRVCGDLGCSNIAVADGIDWGVEQKVDVISMSLGGPAATSAERMAVQNAEKAGVVVVAASGNDGTGKVSYPAALPTVVAVGAIGPDMKKTSFSQWGPELDIMAPGASVISTVPRGSGRDSVVDIVIANEKTRIKSAAFSGTKEISVPKLGDLVPAGLGKPADFAKVNVVGKFALISRGEITFAEKVQNAIKAKATGVVIYNNTAGLMQGTVGTTEIDMAVVMIEQTEGMRLVDLISKGQSAAAEVSTVRSDYAMFDGTSMATPHIAGVAALIRSTNKKLSPAQVRMILSQTALPMGPNSNNEYGSGLVQADKAVVAAAAQQ